MRKSTLNILYWLIIVFLLGNTVPAIQAQTPDFTGLKIMINPGHGGHDSDDRGMPNGFWESEGNLTKGLELRDILEARGAEVVMSRTTNFTEDDLPLSQIAAMANQNNVDLMISIHSNAANQSVNYPMPIFNGKTDDPSVPEAKVFAGILYDHLWTNEATFWTGSGPGAIGDLTLNPSWSYGYGVLYPLTVPGIISEGSFHDYAPEVGRLLSLDYRRQEAWNMYYAMVDYFEMTEQESLGHITGIVRDSLLEKENYSIPNSPDKYEVVKLSKVELLETGEIYEVGDTSKAQWFFLDNPDKPVDFNAGFYYFDSLPAGTYTLVFSGEKYYNDTVSVEVIPHKITYYNEWLETDKTIAPQLLASNPIDGDTINCFDPLSFTFDMNMDSISFAGAFQVSPTVTGTFTWDDKYLNVSFQPDVPYQTNTHYQVTIDTTTQNQWGVGIDTAIQMGFFTNDRNKYNVAFTFPAENQVDVSPLLQFRVIFDAPLKNSSLIDAVAIISQNGDTIGTKGANISNVQGQGNYYFSPAQDLAFNTQYTLHLDGSIQDEMGIPLVDDVDLPFTTMSEIGSLTSLCSFEEISPWTMDYSNSIGIDATSFIYRWVSAQVEGDASLLLRYKFLENSGSKALITTDQAFTLVPEANKVGIWIWGDLSFNDVYLIFDNAYSQKITSINFAGWRYVSLNLTDQMNHITGICVEQTENGNSGGDIYLDYLSQPYYISVKKQLKSAIGVYPNPLHGNSIYIDGLPDSINAKYTVMNNLGQVLQKGSILDNTITLSASSLSYQVLIIHVISKNNHGTFLLLNQQ